jgi:GTP-binding protein
VEDFDTIRRELELYNPALLDKPHLVAASKIDALDDPKRLAALEKHVKKSKLKFFKVSAVAGDGVKALMEAAWPFVAKGREEDARLLALEVEEEPEREVAADYNPALVAPLRDSKKTKKKRR